MLTKKYIEEEFKKADLPITKIRASTLGGFYVYHPFGMEYGYKKYTVIERGDGYIKKRVEPITVTLSFMDDEDLLYMAIVEAKNRKKGKEAQDDIH